MTDHDRGLCLRCGKPAGGHGFCESCLAQLASDEGQPTRLEAIEVTCCAAPAVQEVRLEQRVGAGGGDRGAGPSSEKPPAQTSGGERESDEPPVLGQAQLNNPDLPQAEVARLEEVLTRKDIDPELAACLRADAAGDPQGAANLGVLLEQRGDREGALAAYKRADRRGDIHGSFNLGCLLAEMGDVVGAKAALGRADERGDASAASNLGVLLEREGDLEGAVAAYRRGDERGDAFAAFNLGLLLAGRGDIEGAQAAYRRAAERNEPEVRERALQAEAELTPADEERVEPEAIVAPAPQPEPEEEPQPEADSERPPISLRRWIVALGILALLALLIRRRLRR